MVGFPIGISKLPEVYFQVRTVSFREGISSSAQNLPSISGISKEQLHDCLPPPFAMSIATFSPRGKRWIHGSCARNWFMAPKKRMGVVIRTLENHLLTQREHGWKWWEPPWDDALKKSFGNSKNTTWSWQFGEFVTRFWGLWFHLTRNQLWIVTSTDQGYKSHFLNHVDGIQVFAMGTHGSFIF